MSRWCGGYSSVNPPFASASDCLFYLFFISIYFLHPFPFSLPCQLRRLRLTLLIDRYFSGTIQKSYAFRDVSSYPIYALFYRKRVTINLLTCASFRLYRAKNKACTIELICNRCDVFSRHQLATDYPETFISICTFGVTRHRDFQIALLRFQVVFSFSGTITTAVRLFVLCVYALRFCPPHHGTVFVFAM